MASVSIRETRIRHQINVHRRDAFDRLHHRSVGGHIDARTNERTTTTTMALSFARISSTAGCVPLSLFSSLLDSIEQRASSSNPFIARIHRSYRARSYLGRAIDDGDAGWMTRAWGRIERSRDARDEEGNVCANA